jgi:site-specific DNA recombinase
MKKGIRYLRFSRDKQSVLSIERQDLVTSQWMQHSDIQIFDTFIDDGHSAKTFDRPDMKKLMEFVKKNYRDIDYLVVAELTRFSRDLGDAVNVVKNIQKSYDIRIVSAGRGAIYDCSDSNSFFMMSLEFLLGNSENLKRESDINGGIYTAKAKEGRYIHGKPPYGYFKEGKGATSRLCINENEAKVIRFIYSSYLKNISVYIIYEEAKKMGFTHRGHGSIQKILANPMYSGQQQVKPWREHPGGLFPALHQPLVDMITWKDAQVKLKGKTRPGITVSEAMPLRGVLRCYCSQPVTGAPSRNRWGNYYYYYKCKHSRHVNISVIKAHEKLDAALGYMSLTARMAQAIRINSEQKFSEQIKENRKILTRKKSELGQIHDQIASLEEKYIANRIEFETYNKWFSELRQRRTLTKAEIDKLQRDDNGLYMLLQNNIDRFTDLPYLYNSLETTAKQEFIRLVFDSKLYWQDNIYRTPYIIPAFTHNSLILKQKQLLVLEEKKGLSMKVPSGGAHGTTIEPLINLLSFLQTRVA